MQHQRPKCIDELQSRAVVIKLNLDDRFQFGIASRKDTDFGISPFELFQLLHSRDNTMTILSHMTDRHRLLWNYLRDMLLYFHTQYRKWCLIIPRFRTIILQKQFSPDSLFMEHYYPSSSILSSSPSLLRCSPMMSRMMTLAQAPYLPPELTPAVVASLATWSWPDVDDTYGTVRTGNK